MTRPIMDMTFAEAKSLLTEAEASPLDSDLLRRAAWAIEYGAMWEGSQLPWQGINWGINDLAEMLISKAIRLEPSNPKLYVERGLIREEGQGQTPEGKLNAFKDFVTALALDPNDVEAISLVGSAWILPEEAKIALLKRAIEIDPKRQEAWFNLAEIYRRTGAHEQEYEALQQYIKLIAPDDMEREIIAIRLARL